MTDKQDEESEQSFSDGPDQSEPSMKFSAEHLELGGLGATQDLTPDISIPICSSDSLIGSRDHIMNKLPMFPRKYLNKVKPEAMGVKDLEVAS